MAQAGTGLLRRALRVLSGALVVLILGATINVWRHSSKQLQAVQTAPVAGRDGAEHRLAQLLKFATISHQEAKDHDPAPFLALRGHVESTYPRLHAALSRELFDDTMLLRWPGTDANLAPVLVMAHLDVVPGEDEATWRVPAFSGAVEGGYVWGRGALDMKGPMAAILEALEGLIEAGHQPRRTVYFAFGHDEEIGGLRGNAAIAARFKAQGLKLHAVLDEGSVVTEGVLPNIAKPVALIGIAEKGYVTLELTVAGAGGHSSMPAAVTDIEVLSRALIKVTAMRNAGTLTTPVRSQLNWLAPELPFMQRVVLSNLWLFEPLVRRQLAAKPSSDAMIRTTIAPTMLNASDKENVLPQRTSAMINFRLLPGTTTTQVLESVRKVIGDARVQVAIKGSVISEPSGVSSIDGPAFDDLHRSVRETFPDAIVAPSLVLGATDSRHYRELSGNIYRFIPVRLQSSDIARIHGKDERIAVKHFHEAIAFYTHYLRKQ